MYSRLYAWVRSAQWAHVDAALSRMREAQRRWAALPGDDRVAIVLEVRPARRCSTRHIIGCCFI
jgi:delta 1-pyrroline-5-carboxylate dehydrogenase